MKNRLLDFLACPECRGMELSLKAYDVRGAETVEGVITCRGCGTKYPVINGIPRMLPGRLQGELLKYHADFFKRRRGEFDLYETTPVGNSEDILKKRTLKSFGYQWNVFDDMFEEYVKHWEGYIPDTARPDFFRGKVGLDAGCGFGRHIYRASGNGAEMVGLDLSEAVEAAYKNNSGRDNVYIVQGDIFNPPLKSGAFDFIYSLGVLHHLPDPELGFDSLVKLLVKGQKIFIWCYDNEKPKLYAFIESLRRWSTHINFRLLYVLCFFGALTIRAVFNMPSRLMKLFDSYKSRKVPFDFYARFPFRVLHADLFDLLATPSTRYYHQAELERWFEDRALHVMESSHKVSGWTVLGEK